MPTGDTREPIALAPWNAALRFGIELAALGGWAAGGWALTDGATRWVAAVGSPLVAAAVWGTFRVPGDPGDAPVAVPGALRLAIEVVVLGGGAVGLTAVSPGAGAAYLVALAVHHVAARDRLRRLLSR